MYALTISSPSPAVETKYPLEPRQLRQLDPLFALQRVSLSQLRSSSRSYLSLNYHRIGQTFGSLPAKPGLTSLSYRRPLQSALYLMTGVLPLFCLSKDLIPISNPVTLFVSTALYDQIGTIIHLKHLIFLFVLYHWLYVSSR